MSMKPNTRTGRWFLLAVLAYGMTWCLDEACAAMCAEVKIQIEQELTLERQAFDAHMRIKNGFSTLAMRNVRVVLVFQDSTGATIPVTFDPNKTNALFFVRQDTMSGINNVNGSGTVDPLATADIHWLIIPAAGAGGSGSGVRYLVGATLTYTLADEAEEIRVTPDTITVKPMPKLRLDYFLPDEVFGDDPLTPGIEPPEPFTLGVRVKNTGFGPAQQVAIASGQPRIIDNVMGLQIGYRITGTEVNGLVADRALTVTFGNIEPEQAAVGRWIMECTLSGWFVAFEASYSHRDDLGGRVSSLMEEVVTHTLIKDVRLDTPGADTRRDFLALDNLVYSLYESGGEDYPVLNQSAQAAFQLTRTTEQFDYYTLTLPALNGLYYAAIPFAAGGSAEVVSASRWDGKTLASDNVWISRKRPESGTGWIYYINLFDAGSGGPYSITFGRKAQPDNTAPSLQYIGNKVVRIGEELGFLVRATDVDGAQPDLQAVGLPASATWTPSTNGTAQFFWTPTAEDHGVHPVRFIASDGEYLDWETIKIYVGLPGEALVNGLPESLLDWRVGIHALEAGTDSGTAVVRWGAVDGMPYDVYVSDDPAGGDMTWRKVGTRTAEASEADLADGTLGTKLDQRFYRVVISGDMPDAQGIWGVIRKEVPPGYTMLSPPLAMDRSMAGDFGQALAAMLNGHDAALGDRVHIFTAASQAWRTLYLDSGLVWRESDGQVSDYELPVGAGLFVESRNTAPVNVTFTGPVGPESGRQVTLNTGWNLLGLSEGRNLPVRETFETAQPVGGSMEESADLIVIQNPDGSWRRLMYVEGWGAPYDGNWFDLQRFVPVSTNDVLPPGAAYYYLRRGPDTTVTF